MKKCITYVMVLLLSLSLVACGTAQAGESGSVEAMSSASKASWGIQDGVYFAQEADYSAKSGWKYVVVVEVKDGAIASVDWDGAHKNGGESKKTKSLNGTYGMNGAEGTWAEQSARVVEYLMGNYATSGTMTPDSISGASIDINPLFDLAAQALASGPVGYGPYVDGAYSAMEPVSDSSWRYTADFTVIGGYIVTANWDAVNKNGGDTKKVRSMNGEYNMNGAEGAWHEQAARVEAALLENQGVGTITFAEGKTDDIASVSITSDVLFNLAAEALVQR